MAEPPYRLDVHYPAHMYGGAMQLDDRIMMVAAGFGSSGMGQGNRDMNFFFKTKEERDACAERINKAGIMEAKVVRREDLDPSEDPNLRTKEEIEQAHQELSDFFHPRKKYSEDCDCSGDYHEFPCSLGTQSTFQGWRTSVSKYREVTGDCVKEGCTDKACMRIRLNIWGVLGEYDVCGAHGMMDRDGKMVSKDGIRCDGL